ncbi:MAG: hypothetical protein AAF223_09030, partial [Bacteroidota bacterium]
MALVSNIADTVIALTDFATWERMTSDFAEPLLQVALRAPITAFTDKLDETKDLYGIDAAGVAIIAALAPDLVLPPTLVIWAEENSTLGNNTYEWAFGNGANSPANAGFVMPFGTWQLRGMSLHIGGTNAA